MDITLGERLTQLRKAHNLSQEQLAEKLGVSRQAVSKWERDEAAPDTNNLIMLAKIYGVTIDELLNADLSEENININKQRQSGFKDDNAEGTFYYEDDEKRVKINFAGIEVDVDEQQGKTQVKVGKLIDINVSNDDGQFVHQINKNPVKKKKPKKQTIVRDITTSVFALIVLTTYIVLGFVFPSEVNGASNVWGTSSHWWSVGWTFFILVPTVGGLIDFIYERNISKFPVATSVIFTYLFLGMGWGLWHPYWALFFIIPVFYTVTDGIKKLRKLKASKNEVSDDPSAIEVEISEIKNK